MKKIGIIAAMEEEMLEIKNIMTSTQEKQIYDLTFIQGEISNKECILVQCGIGKVNAARTTQILIDNFDIEFIVNIGVAGAISKELNIGDIVIAKNLVQYDFDITAFGHDKGYITGVGKYIDADNTLIKKCESVMQNINNKVYIGTIASGDTFCTDRKIADELFKEFNALCVEMEGAAIGQICMLDKIPFIVIRGISDSPNGNNNIDFEEYLKHSSKICAMFMRKLVEEQV